MPAPAVAFFSPARRASFRALASSFVPETEDASPAEWTELEATIERVLASRPAKLRRQLAQFLRLLQIISRLRYGTGLAQLDPAHRHQLLERLARSPLPVLRRGIWGLRTLILMGWYTQSGVAAAIGYRANPDGWSARR